METNTVATNISSKVLVCDNMTQDSIDLMKSKGLYVDVKTGLKEKELMEIIPNYNAVIVRSATKITKPVIDSSKDLRLIVRGGVGIDNIDVQSAQSRNIAVYNTPEASTNSVAELTIALILSAARFVTKADSTMKKMLWEKKNLVGHEIAGSTLGIVGAGRIGLAVAKKALCLGMKVYAVEHPEANPGFRNEDVCMTSLEEVLRVSDYISMHLPYKKGTPAIIGEKEFSIMKKGVVLLNLSRGGAVDEDALLKALDNGTVSTAALDVWYEEPSKNEKLIQHERVIALPHLGASTKEGQFRVCRAAADKVINFFNDNKC